MALGVVVQVIGPVIDIKFPEGELPQINEAIEIELDNEKIVLEAVHHTGDNIIRCISMSATEV